jgi:hypothetical protein
MLQVFSFSSRRSCLGQEQIIHTSEEAQTLLMGLPPPKTKWHAVVLAVRDCRRVWALGLMGQIPRPFVKKNAVGIFVLQNRMLMRQEAPDFAWDAMPDQLLGGLLDALRSARASWAEGWPRPDLKKKMLQIFSFSFSSCLRGRAR